jgi:3beta-hydroxy-delta5-steroid dehydrogenase/steroid delta-isomerase
VAQEISQTDSSERRWQGNQPPATPRLTDVAELGRCLVTGGAGFVGRSLVKALLAGGCQVNALVNRTQLKLDHPNLRLVHGNVTNADDMQRACAGVDTVFHTVGLVALMGGRFATDNYRKAAWLVNVKGTQNVIDACRTHGVKRLIHTSSVDVVFDGKPLPLMTEDLPYARRPKSVYGETKIAGEALVLKANEPGGLLTCTIRPDGIYGAEPSEVIDRFRSELAAGRLVARLGKPDTLQDNSEISSLVHGEILAALNLVPGGVACGQAYFIGDGEPMNSFDFFRPLIEGLGHPFPTRVIPANLLRPIVTAWEALHFLVGFPKPMLTPHELDKVTVTHYGSIAKARRDLGYEPLKTVAEAMQECLVYCKEAERSQRPAVAKKVKRRLKTRAF